MGLYLGGLIIGMIILSLRFWGFSGGLLSIWGAYYWDFIMLIQEMALKEKRYFI